MTHAQRAAVDELAHMQDALRSVSRHINRVCVLTVESEAWDLAELTRVEVTALRTQVSILEGALERDPRGRRPALTGVPA